MDKASTERFSDRVDNYKRFRPSYPLGVLELLMAEAGLHDGSTAADVGSGTGIWTEILLRSGAKVYGVEPNQPMREAAELELGHHPSFESVDGTAEATTLPDASVDLITAAQAFHWFDMPVVRKEFARILRPSGLVALIWNNRVSDETPFLSGYETLLRTYAPDYLKVRHKDISADDLEPFFSAMSIAKFSNNQEFDLDGLIGRLLSSSYVPTEGEAGHDEIMHGAKELFGRTNEDGKVKILYETEVFYGPVAK